MVAFRPLFRPSDDFVVLIPITLGRDKRLMPGTVVKKGEFPAWRLRSWYNRRLVAKAGSAFAAARLQHRERLLANRKRTEEKRGLGHEESLLGSNVLPADVEIAPDHAVQLGVVVTYAFERANMAVDEWNSMADDEREQLLLGAIEEMRANYHAASSPQYRVEKQGGGWFVIYAGDEQVGKVQGQAALDEWMKAREGEAGNGG